MKKTRLLFQFGKFGDSYLIDPNSIFINGWIFNWQMLNDFLFKEEESNLPELIEHMADSKMYEIELDIWQDSDDYRSWIDFSVITYSII